MESFRSCMFINDDPVEQALFESALNAICVDVTCYMVNYDVDGLWLIQKENISPDYIFIELDTACVKGVWFLRHLRRNSSLKHIPVIVHSNEPMPDRVDELKREGAFAIYFGHYRYWRLCNILSFYFHNERTKICLN